MSDLKFTCSSCGQHIRCDQDYANERIPCPNCGAVVRVPVDAPLVTKAPSPAAVPPTPATGTGLDVPTLEDNFLQESGTPMPSTPPVTEREQQIAAARAARPVVPNTTVKPRLSYILNGGQAPPPEENEHATQPEHKLPEESPDAKSFHE
jgi:DNA-directed RNA polymerase subunit RPC12/RpoP